MTLMTDLDRVPPISLGTRLRIAREWRSLDQDDMAEVLGVSRQTVSNYEREFTSISKLALNAWAAATDTDVDWLKTGEVQSEPTGPGGAAGTTSEVGTMDYGGFVTDIRDRIAA